ncbi:hypothetical protein B1748_29290 [Paenibacillus sp. MY03]|uniref:DUF423 domain-containing protein n=1 Tax=Paenibacillus TaxID=44249 RepID=UPI000B3C39ED|nr:MULTISPECIES: DUF423 domain-containing protein [Paenibacillus]OUS70062.1 hypothetical protein B1748_29290 [Paenibacillus sp. MY03]QNK56052.1 DUF423 domain-containing protein [Paenibacillus sp. PAMC21692]
MFPAYFVIGAVNAALAIALGAFGAHGLEGKITEHYIDIFETGVKYHMYGALGLMLVALMDKIAGGGKKAVIGARLLLAGMLIFGVSLYVLALTGYSKLGMITPIGGVAMLAGWGFVIAGVLNQHRKSK